MKEITKKNKYQLSIINYQLSIIMLFLFLLGCNTPVTYHPQNDKETMVIDSVFASPTDSLEYIVNHLELPPHDRLRIYKKLSWDFIDEDNDKAIFYGNLGLDLLKMENNDTLKVFLYYNIAVAYMEKEVFDSATIYFDEALLCANKIENEDYEISIYFSYGKLCSEMGNELGSIGYYEKALQLAEKHENDEDIAFALYSIAFNHFNDENHEQAEKFLLKSLQIYQTKVNEPDIYTISHLHSLLSRVCFATGRNEDALVNAQKALELAQSAGILFYEIEALLDVATVFASKQEYDKALEMTNQALAFTEEEGTVFLKIRCLEVLGNIYYDTHQFSKSKIYFLKALELSHPNDLVSRKLTLRSLIKNFLNLKETDEAMKAFTTFDSISTALYQQNTQYALSDLEVSYETGKKELEIEKQRNVIQHKNLQLKLGAGSVGIAVVILALLWYLLRIHRRKNLILAEMNATKDKFFSIISHDLKNPVVAQQDAIRKLVDKAELLNNDEMINSCRDLLKSADEEVKLLYSLLTWAQIQTQGISFTPVTFDLPKQLQTDIILIRKMSESKNIILKEHIPDHLLVTGDINILLTVIRNLLTNAVKFTPVGGEVSLAIETSHSDKHTITVSDTGIGMNQEEIHNLFHIDNSMSRKGTLGEQGTGLGLIVCNEMLKKHGSILFVESESGKGSRFWFEI